MDLIDIWQVHLEVQLSYTLLSEMAGESSNPVGYYHSRPAADPTSFKGPIGHEPQFSSHYNGVESNGVPQFARPSLREQPYSEGMETPVSPRTQLEPNPPWANRALDHRTALEPSIILREIPSPDFRPLNPPSAGFGRSNNIQHQIYSQAGPLQREREGYLYGTSDRPHQPLQGLPPPNMNEQHQQLKNFPPPQHAQGGYQYQQPGETSIYPTRPMVGSQFQRPYPPTFDPRIQPANAGYQHLERRHTTPLPPNISMQAEVRREPHNSTLPMSPQREYSRQSIGQMPGNYITGSDTRHPAAAYRPNMTQQQQENSHGALSQNEQAQNLMQNSMQGPRQMDFQPSRSQYAAPDQGGVPRGMDHPFKAPPPPTGRINSLSQSMNDNYEPPSKRVKTEDRGSVGTSIGNGTDQDTEDEDMYNDEGRGGSGTPEQRKRKFSSKSTNRQSISRKRSLVRPDLDEMDEEQHLPSHVDGVRVNKEWGLTKAGKARQRLPQACIACRKKKIKCMYVSSVPILYLSINGIRRLIKFTQQNFKGSGDL